MGRYRRAGRTWLLVLIALAVGIGVGIYGYHYVSTPKEPELTSSFINGRLEAVSELTTAKLTYTGLIKYSEGKIPFLTQNSFSMIYTASVRAGMDLSKASVEITEEEVAITLPVCEVQSVEVDERSIEFYDEHWALFNRLTKEEVIDMVSAAKEDVLAKADLENLLDSAKRQTEILIHSLLDDGIGERKLVIRTGE